MRRAQSTTPSSSSSATGAGPQSNLYKGELNKKDVQEGYGMGMAVKVSERHVCCLCVVLLYTICYAIYVMVHSHHHERLP